MVACTAPLALVVSVAIGKQALRPCASNNDDGNWQNCTSNTVLAGAAESWIVMSPVFATVTKPTLGFDAEETVALHWPVVGGVGVGPALGVSGGLGVGTGVGVGMGLVGVVGGGVPLTVGGFGETRNRLSVVPPQPAINTRAETMSPCKQDRGMRKCMAHTPRALYLGWAE